MTDAERIERLNAVLEGTGATVTDPYTIWATESQLSDQHVSLLADWADLSFFIADATQITNASLDTICSFRRLTSLSIGYNAITSDALATCDFPPEIENLGLSLIPLNDAAVSRILLCNEISVLNLNDCQLSLYSLSRLAQLPQLMALEALRADSNPETSRVLSEKHPQLLLRLSDGLWRGGVCKRKPFPEERA